MINTSLATKYRPRLLKDFLGNENTVQSLRALMERKDIPHTILFTGPSGTGKTTLARIVAKRLRCSEWDFSEHNAADFRGIDSVRDIIRDSSLCPMDGSCRVWLLDECHQISRDGMHALLKIIEDTPKHVYFLLATTDPEKLLPTIRTRCVTFEVRPLNDETMESLLNSVVEKEGVEKLHQEVVDQIVQDSMGSARMGLSILDKVINMNPDEMLEAAKQQAEAQNEAIQLCRALIAKKPWREVSRVINGLEQDPEQVRRAVLGYAQSVLLKFGTGQAYIVMASFRSNFYDSGKAGLVASCYEAING